jgi:uncharacterized protein YbjT (DUF2867 family)
MKILVTAAAGNQGKLLLPKLAAAGHSVRAARLKAGRDAELRALGADEVVTGDLYSCDAYARALDGCDAVYHIGASGSHREREGGFAMLEAAKRCGTPHVVMSSVHYSIVNIVQHRYKRDIEEALYESGLAYTVLKPCDFMMPQLYIDPVLKTGRLPMFWDITAERRGSLIDIEDLTDVAAKVLTEGARHHFAGYELVGPDKLTAQEVARILSRVLRRDIPLEQWSARDRIERMFGTREPTEPFARHTAEVLESISAWYSKHSFVGNPALLEWLLGRKPNSFEAFVRRTLGERGFPQGAWRAGA